MEAGTIEDVVNLPEGTIAIQWPSRLSVKSKKFVKSWVDLMLQKMDMEADDSPMGDDGDPGGDGA